MTATWTAPKTWADNELVTAALLNTHLRDNLEFLKVLTDIVIIQDQKAQNTHGGTFTSGAWRTRDLNTEVADSGNFATIASNQISLAAGTWFCIAAAPGNFCDAHQARLQNITDSATLIVGSNQYSLSTGMSPQLSWCIGKFTISATKTIELQHQCQTTRATDGLGRLANFSTEVYSMVILIKLT